VWVRLWHWANALLFLVLAASGFSLHFSGGSGSLIPFKTAIVLHNAAGAASVIILAVYLIFLCFTGQWRQYLKLRAQTIPLIGRNLSYYLFGVFKGVPHPESPTAAQKFNTLQQISYAFVLVAGMIPIAVTGVMLAYPESAPRQVLGAGGIWPIAVLHTLLAYGLVAFFVGHMYLTTMGATLWSDIKAMITGWHETSHGDTPDAQTEESGGNS
jgi:thiosulfate reductase cytochrome b subunit